MRIERTRDNPIQERAQSAAPAQTIGAATRSIESISQAITREVDRNSNPRGGIPERGFDRTRDRERKRSTGGEDGLRSHQGLDGEGW
jgi:Leucine-rich repeat (LRR) protein